MDTEHNRFIGDEKKFAAIQAQIDSAKRKGEAKGKGESARKSALNADQDAWETNRLLTRYGHGMASMCYPSHWSLTAPRLTPVYSSHCICWYCFCCCGCFGALSGVVMSSGVDLDFEDDTENRVTLMVHNIRPPFLDGRIAFTTQMQIVSTVRALARTPAFTYRGLSSTVSHVRGIACACSDWTLRDGYTR